MKSSGYTLIELVIVIIILGILVAIAIPKYIDITEQAKIAADRGQLAALRSSTHILYASNILFSAGTNAAWPGEFAVWNNLTQSNAWKTGAYQTGVVYTATNGIWSVAGGE